MEALPRRSGKFPLRPHNAFRLYGICPKPLFTDENRQLLELYVMLNGTANITDPAAYYQLPNIYVAACQIFMALQREAQGRDDGHQG